MNEFTRRFKDRIMLFWESSSKDENLLTDVLEYANLNFESFLKDIKEVQFDLDLTPLPIVLEALSKNTEKWGDFYVEVLDEIFTKAGQVDKPGEILTFISEFYFIENDTKPFVQKIVNRLYKEMDSASLAIQLKAICTLPSYLTNPSIKDKELLIESLRQKLDDKNWKVRYVAFKSLGYENLLPKGQKLSVIDIMMKTIFGAPEMV